VRTYLIAAVCCLATLRAAGAADRAAPPPEDVVPVPRGVAYIPDVTYRTCDDADKTRLELDIAYPTKGDGPLPALLFFHGGGWVIGSRKNMTPYILRAAQAGYVAVTVSYRLSPKHPFPAPVEDAKCAVRWLRANADKYQIDKDHIGAVGYSAGGQLACLLGSPAGEDRSGRVQAVVSYYGVMDLSDAKHPLLALAVKQYLSGPANQDKDAVKRASPLHHASKDSPPTLLIHGDADTLVPVAQSRAYAAKLKEAGAKVSLVEVAKADHNFVGDAEQDALRTMFRFLDEHLKP
jgi:acetyl esterase/lipase